ncbi:MAG: hypothetical protein KME15_05500 [Drouetiella hepatica Uher 2000/2452]|jgi:hypothetical protein|uniref:Uncharacterized protein n=1 Tax=Drouetiella hepatica Uher 2000/2452 TaxID=904376 RepID=A0A951Q7C0_9CYAN|nr:hypothetical protein [Drouetiella hepatica Uher 2000/2452]
MSQPPDDRSTELPLQPVEPAEPVHGTIQSGNKAQSGSQVKSSNKVAALFRMLGQILGIVLAALPLAFNLLRQLAQLGLKGLRSIQVWWVATLPKIRSRLPEPWKTKLPEQILTAIALLFLLSFLSVTLALLPGKPPSLVKAPSSNVPNLPNEPAPVRLPNAVSLNKLTKIQDQLAEITASYAEGLVESVQVDRHSRLKVTVGDAWYALEPGQQDKLANEVLKRSYKLKFDQLELTDPEGVLLARSPVVGSGILMLERVSPGI